MTDNATNLALKQLASDVSRKLNLNKYPAILGDANGAIYDTQNPGSGYVLVREKTSNGLSYPRKVRGPYAGAPVTMRPGTPVELEYDKDGILYVARVGFQDSLAVGANPLAANSSDGMANSFVNQSDIITLLSTPTAPPTTSVALRGWKPVIGGTLYDFPGALVDLSSFIPSAGNHCVAVIFLKSDFTTIEVKASTAKSTADPIMPADIQEAITARSTASLPLWAWRLHDGQSTIVQADRFLDLRQAWNTNDFGGFAVRTVTAAGAVTVALTDFTVVINKSVGAATTVNLPASPATGTIFIIKDGKGDAGTNNITITPASGTIDGSATYVMTNNYQSCGIQYTGAEWSIIFGNGSGGGGANYQTIQGNGSAATQRPIVDFIDGTGTTVAVTDDGPGTRTKVQVNAPTMALTKSTKSFYQRTILYDNTLNSAGSWDVSGLDQTYDHLEVILYGLATVATSAVGVNWTVNNDGTGTNYLSNQTDAGINGGGAVFLSSANNNNQQIAAIGGTGSSARFSIIKALIPNYTNSQHKQILLEFGLNHDDNTILEGQFQNLWKSTSAINRLAFAVGNATTTFEAGSRLQIIGIKAETLVTDITGGRAVLFTGSANTTVASTAAETTLVGSVSGSQTISAGTISVAGRQLRIDAWGYLSDTGTPTLELKFKLGSTVILDSGAVTLASGFSNKLWHFQGVAVVQTAGASGKIFAQGQFTQNGTVTDIVATAQISIDLTASLVADLTAQWGTSSASNTITCSNISLEQLN